MQRSKQNHRDEGKDRSSPIFVGTREHQCDGKLKKDLKKKHSIKNCLLIQVWWSIPAIPALDAKRHNQPDLRGETMPQK
jgi:hypothetical protein